MNDMPKLSESMIRQHAAGESFSRGRRYYEQGAVAELVLRGNVLQAQVEGSEYEPYRVRVAFDAGGITTASCTCPYDYGGWCKHIVATLLAYIHEPRELEVRRDIEEVLAELDRDQLQTVLLGLAKRDPDVADEIEMQVSLLKAAPAADQPSQPGPAPTRHTPVDPQPIRRQMRAILRPSRYEYGYAGDVVEQVREVAEKARRFAEAGDGRNALALLEAITDEYTEGWYEIDDSDGELGGFFEELADFWTEALLSTDLTPAERREWAKKLQAWQREADEYGVDSWFEIPRLAAQQGWDDPALQRVLQGEITEKGAWQGERPDYADELAQIRLRILERQGRQQEYLHLAEGEGQLDAYVLMLAKMGRAQEAVDEGLRYLASADEALALATALRERGEIDKAVQVAEHGLTLGEPKAGLASWLRDLAMSSGRRDLALRAAEVAFRSAPSLAAYLQVQELADEGWPALRETLLDHLRTMTSSWFYGAAAVDIFLHEGLLDDAIKVVEKGASYDLLRRVMDAAIKERPDWVIGNATKQAEQIMDAGQAQQYEHAVSWLQRARDAYRASGRQNDWRQYLGALRIKHARKYKLMGLLQQL